MASIYLTDTFSLKEIKSSLENNKSNFKDNLVIKSGNSYLDKVSSKINSLSKEIENDYSKVINRINGIVTQTELLERKISNDAKNKLSKDVDTINNISKETVTDSKEENNTSEIISTLGSIGATIDVGVISAAEGVLNFGEDIVKGLWIATNAVTTGIEFVDSIFTLQSREEFKEEQKEKWDNVKAFVTTDYVESAFDAFYDDTSLGQTLKNNAYGFETTRNIGKGVGYIGASVLTGGAIASAVGVGASATSAVATSLTKSAINAGVYATSQLGSETGNAWKEGASTTEGLAYGVATSLYRGSEMFVGSMINSYAPFGSGTTSQTLGNVSARVGLDTIFGAVDATITPALKTIYTPNEETLINSGYNPTKEELKVSNNDIVEAYKNSSFSEKYKLNFEANGGIDNVAKTAIFSGGMSLLSEMPSAIQSLSDINKTTKLYNEMDSVSKEYNSITNNSNIDSNVKASMISDLEIKRNNLLNTYDNLTTNQKYDFELKTTKEAIKSGNTKITNNILSTSNTKNIWDNLSNNERLSLVSSMNESQMKNLFDKIGESNASKFINKNSNYITNRFLNTNNTSNILNIESGMPHKTTTDSLFNKPKEFVAVQEVNLSDEIKTKLYSNRLFELEDVYLEIVNDAVDDLGNIESIATTSRSSVVSSLDDKSGTIYDIENRYDELGKTSRKIIEDLVSVTVTTSSADSSYKTMTETISQKRSEINKEINSVKELIKDYKDKKTISAYNNLISDYESLDSSLVDIQTKLDFGIESLNKEKTNIGMEIFGESDQSKIDNIIKSSKEKNITIEDTSISRDKGKTLTTEMVNKRIKERFNTDNEDKLNIGLQFFATPKKNNIVKSLFVPKTNETDIFFSDFDDKSYSYGANQGFGIKNVSYVTSDNGLPINRNKFYNYLLKKHPNMSLEDIKNRWDKVFESKTVIKNPNEIISYIADSQSSSQIKDINRAINTFEGMTTKVTDREYLRLHNILKNKGMNDSEASTLLNKIDSTGVCTYADIANEIITSFRYNPSLYKETFGYRLYSNANGEKVLNANELLLDLYIFANSNNGKDLFTNKNGIIHLDNLDTESQEYLSKDRLSVVEEFLKSKDPSLSYNYKTNNVKPSSVRSIKARIKDGLNEGNVGLIIFSKEDNIYLANKNNCQLGNNGITRFLDDNGNEKYSTSSWGEGMSHAVFVTGINNKGVIVSSWGERLTIPYEDLAGSFISIRKSTIGGIK